jgi:2'-5' RNA ligase
MNIRSFISVDIGPLDEFVKFEDEISATGAIVKLVAPENIHITLKFLGPTDEELVPEINEIMVDSTKDDKSFNLKFKSAGAFPNLNYMKVLWIGIEDSGPMPELAKSLDAKLNRLGFSSEKRDFKPHVTLGRVKSKKEKNALKKLLINNKDRYFGEITVDSIRLKKSILDSKGPTYYTVVEVPLK